jgi:uncharacterized membrane protein
MVALPPALEIIFEVQRKKNNEKITRRKINFSAYKMCFCFFFWGSLLLSNPITFLFLIHLNDLKCYKIAT